MFQKRMWSSVIKGRSRSAYKIQDFFKEIANKTCFEIQEHDQSSEKDLEICIVGGGAEGNR